MKKIIFIANNNIGTSLTGGDTIFLQFLKNWSKKVKITIFASAEAITLIQKHDIRNISIIKTDALNKNPSLTTLNLIFHQIRRSYKGIKAILINRKIIKQASYVYSVSDFYPDLLPAILSKIINPKIKWLAGFYLFAPNPFSKTSPYNKTGQSIKGFIYYIFQQPAYFLVKKFANTVLVTSYPDTKKFSQKTIVVQGGVDFNDIKNIKKIPLSKRKYHAVFMGRLHPQKGVLELIDIWKIVIKYLPQAKLAIIGDGQLEDQIKSKIKKFKLNQNIEMLGFMSGTNLYKVFANSKIVLHPATYDSGGMSAAQAMALGLPLVSYNLESLKTYYPTGALKTKCFSKKQFAKNILKLLNNRKVYADLSQEADHLIKNNWGWQKRSTSILSNILSFN